MLANQEKDLRNCGKSTSTKSLIKKARLGRLATLVTTVSLEMMVIKVLLVLLETLESLVCWEKLDLPVLMAKKAR